MVLENEKGGDGGINPSSAIKGSDICINGMVLNFASYFGADQGALASLVDLIVAQVMPDSGFNCERTSGGSVHRSLHTTISAAEGIAEYAVRGYSYRLAELRAAQASSHEFMLAHRLFRSDHTGAVIDRKMLMLSYPSWCHYDILRALSGITAGYSRRSVGSSLPSFSCTLRTGGSASESRRDRSTNSSTALWPYSRPFLRIQAG
jgi:hypothetical protein